MLIVNLVSYVKIICLPLTQKTTSPLEIVHIDVWGFTLISSNEGSTHTNKMEK